MPAALTVTGERPRLHSRSLSTKRHQIAGRAGLAGALAAISSAMRSGLALNPQTRIDDVVKQIDDKVDDDKKEADQHQISGHDRYVGEAHCLDEHKSHPGPLEHGFCNDS